MVAVRSPTLVARSRCPSGPLLVTTVVALGLAVAGCGDRSGLGRSRGFEEAGCAVRGVDPSDVLNVRAGPSSKDEVVGTIPPEARGVVGVGVRRQIGPSTWREVKYGTVRGWVNERFLVEERKSR